MFAAVAAAFAFAPAAQATPIHYEFTVNVTNGPLASNVSSGTFSYDDSLVPGGSIIGTGLLTALDFTFNGIAYDTGTANSSYLDFAANGDLIGFQFGNHCFAGTCNVDPRTNDWFVLASPYVSLFAYSTPTFNGMGFGNATYALSPVSVPEPGALGLFGFGLLLLGGVVARRQRALQRSA